jgi:hypothetical protein
MAFTLSSKMPAEDKAIEEAAKTARHYLDSILLEPLSEFGLLLRDKISFWRFKNQVNIVEKARVFLETRSVDVTGIADSVLPEQIVPLIEAGGEISDPQLSDMFASLLASSIDPSTSKSVHPSFAKVLNQCSSFDARVLNQVISEVRKAESESQDSLAQEGSGVPKGTPLYRALTAKADNVVKAFGVSREEVLLSFENLRRLGICDRGHNMLADANYEPIIGFTEFGRRLMDVCAQTS